MSLAGLLLILSAGWWLFTGLAPASTEVPVVLPAGWGEDVAAGKPIIARRGGITHGAWGNANDAVDYGTPTDRPNGGRWANSTNEGDGTYEVVDLGAIRQLMGVGYRLDWDGAFQNPLTVQVEVSTDNEIWATVSRVVHPYSTPHVSNHIDVNLAIDSGPARYIRFSLPPDGAWNGWGNFFQLRAYAAADE
ncbi:MAG: discoidin domain-containing protein [Chloroflexi bacterium]|nr:discoidin domain-containing protein [Chloroflexota bacterium]